MSDSPFRISGQSKICVAEPALEEKVCSDDAFDVMEVARHLPYYSSHPVPYGGVIGNSGFVRAFNIAIGIPFSRSNEREYQVEVRYFEMKHKWSIPALKRCFEARLTQAAHGDQEAMQMLTPRNAIKLCAPYLSEPSDSSEVASRYRPR